MQSTDGGGRLSQSTRQSVVGLMLLIALGVMGGFVLWLQNFSFGGRSYRATIQFPNAGGMTPGTRVAYRGVKVGQVRSIKPEPEGVAVEIEISPADRLIPSNAEIETTQAGLVGETSIDITPLQTLPSIENIAKPLDPDCDPTIIICNGARLQGQGQLDVNALIRSLLRISDTLGDPEVTATVRSIAQRISKALGEIAELGGQLSGFVEDARESGSIQNLNSTIASLGDALDDISSVVVENRLNVAEVLESLKDTSDQLKITVSSLDPIVNQLQQSEFIDNLDTLSANAIDATANLRDLTKRLDDPQTILLLQQTLESARSVFQNVEKITSDVDQLTGNPQFREDLERLIDGLSGLVSSTQQLYQQAEYARIIESMSAVNLGSSTLIIPSFQPVPIVPPQYSIPVVEDNPTVPLFSAPVPPSVPTFEASPDVQLFSTPAQPSVPTFELDPGAQLLPVPTQRLVPMFETRPESN
ncbi:MAG: MCE family protein [Cyanothece sp. SIO1E1]|nr:MCE family protein [Cyanothece sp. SIO1E1]